MIPKIIHFIWLGSPLPAWAERNIAEFRRLNPEHEIRIHGADAIVDEYRPHCTPDEHASARSDLIRYGILERDGGWYFDVDYWPLRPVEDAERAYALDGSQLFASWMNNPRINNGVLACGPGLPLWRKMAEWIHDGGVKGRYGGRTKYGPRLITRLFEQTPEQVCIASWPWFHGVPDVMAGKMYRRLQRAADPEFARMLVPATNGQLPFAFHLWAHTHTEQIDGHPAGVIAGVGTGDRLIAICGQPERKDDGSRPWHNIAAAAAKLGFRAEIVDYQKPDALEKVSDIPDAVVCWNALKGVHAKHAELARRYRAKTLILEHGFFGRNEHFQADHEGILHRASWLARINEPAPPDGAERLRVFYPDGITPMQRRHGYVLVLGQVAGDSQLIDSEVAAPRPLQRLVLGSLPPDVAGYFRPHPATMRERRLRTRQILPILGGGPDPTESDNYKQHKTGCGLAEALEGAVFVIAINSNALNEALAAGVPCLAFGPFLGIAAGVVHPATIKTLRNDIAEMVEGWCPQREDVENYLQWLAARQWSVAEFESPELLGRLLSDAGLELPRQSHAEAAG